MTQLVIIDRNTQDILQMLRTAEGQSRIDVLTHQVMGVDKRVMVIDKMLRRRSGRSKKLAPVPGDDAIDQG
jgi:hypothetical protein